MPSSYIYADLIVPPIMDAYREYYGTEFTAILSGDYLLLGRAAYWLRHPFYLPRGRAGLIPDLASLQIDEEGIEMNYKLVLNGLATIFFLFFY